MAILNFLRKQPSPIPTGLCRITLDLGKMVLPPPHICICFYQKDREECQIDHSLFGFGASGKIREGR